MADVFVVADWRKPGQRDTWHARLCGGRLASWELVVRNKGPSTVYTPAIATERHVWIFPSFLQAHPELARIVHLVAGLPGSKWRLTMGDNVTLDAFLAATKNRRALETIGLVSKQQKGQQDQRRVNHPEPQNNRPCCTTRLARNAGLPACLRTLHACSSAHAHATNTR